MSSGVDVLVIGAGAAGFAAALAARSQGARVLVLDAGAGATSLGGGLWDVASDPAGSLLDVLRPARTLRDRVAALVAERPFHPYARLTSPLACILDAHRRVLTALDGYRPLDPDGVGIVVATDLGLLRRTDTAQEEILSLDLDASPVGVVGLEGSSHLDAEFVASSLNDLVSRTALGGPRFEPTSLSLLDPRRAADLHLHELAAWVENEGRSTLVPALKEAASRMGVRAWLVPPLLGLRPSDLAAAMQRELGASIGEVAASLAGPQSLRLRERMLTALTREECVVGRERVVRIRPRPDGSEVVLEDGETLRPGAIVLATGKHVGGGLEVSAGVLREPLASLPIYAGASVDALPTHPGGKDPEREFGLDLFEGGPGYRKGVGYDGRMRALGEGREPAAPDLFVAGAILDGFDPARDGTGLGCAITTGTVAGMSAAERAGSRG